MSTHKCEVVRVLLEEHPAADRLSIVKVHGYECAVRTEEWKNGDLGVYIPPDSIVPDTEAFKFLDGHTRIRARKIRGRYSQGVLVHAPEGVQEGDDCMEMMGIEHYEPPMPMISGGANEKGPEGFFPVYDIEDYNRYAAEVFVPGEEVVATEKIHGCNARYVWAENRIWAGSRTSWKKRDEKVWWWQAATQNPRIEEWCCAHPGFALYGEVFGPTQKLKYGAKQNQMLFCAFDILEYDRWLDHDEARRVGQGLTWVPEVYRGVLDDERLRALAEENSSVPGADHHREGLVVKPITERRTPEIGRVQLKLKSNRYLAKN